MKDILRRNNPQYNSIENSLKKRTLGAPIQVSKSTVGTSMISINNQKEISFDKITPIMKIEAIALSYKQLKSLHF